MKAQVQTHVAFARTVPIIFLEYSDHFLWSTRSNVQAILNVSEDWNLTYTVAKWVKDRSKPHRPLKLFEYWVVNGCVFVLKARQLGQGVQFLVSYTTWSASGWVLYASKGQPNSVWVLIWRSCFFICFDPDIRYQNMNDHKCQTFWSCSVLSTRSQILGVSCTLPKVDFLRPVPLALG